MKFEGICRVSICNRFGVLHPILTGKKFRCLSSISQTKWSTSSYIRFFSILNWNQIEKNARQMSRKESIIWSDCCLQVRIWHLFSKDILYQN